MRKRCDCGRSYYTNNGKDRCAVCRREETGRLSRKRCQCGRFYNPSAGHDACWYCRADRQRRQKALEREVERLAALEKPPADCLERDHSPIVAGLSYREVPVVLGRLKGKSYLEIAEGLPEPASEEALRCRMARVLAKLEKVVAA